MIYIYAVSDSHKHFESAIWEYTKRLWKSLSIKYIKPSKKDTQKEIIQEEWKKIIIELGKISAYKILLYINAEQLDSIEFHKLIEQRLQTDADIVFLIWWAYGVSDQVLENIDKKMSFSKMTFPHGMALLVLVEQIYRSQTIKQGKKYHH